MKNHDNTSMDGFVPRRRGSTASSTKGALGSSSESAVRPVELQDVSARKGSLERSNMGLSRSDIDESLREIDDEELNLDKKPKKGRKNDKVRKPHSKRRKIIKWIVLLLVAVLVGVAVWAGYKFIASTDNIFKGDIFGLVQKKELKMDSSGRSNVLIFGTSEDDQGGKHPGGLLTDSIMVLSVDQKKKDAFMVSIPRDLWVSFDGTACIGGYQSKINELFQCFGDGGKNGEAGATALAKKVGEVTGLDIQYYSHINYSVVRETVNAIGGIDVDVMGNGAVPYGVKPGSILDRNFDWKCKYQCYYVKYEPGVHHMDGEHALAFMRARNASGGYGLAAGNFDREKNQQKVLVALRNKALSAGTLSDVGKVMGIVDALGNNLRTNFDTSEIRTIMELAGSIDAASIKTIDLIDEEKPVMTTDRYGSQNTSIVRPIAGLLDYSDVKAYIQRQINSDDVTREAANIAILNGSGITGLARKEGDSLEAMGMVVSYTGNAPGEVQKHNIIYQIGKDNSATKARLESRYSAKVSTDNLPIQVANDVDFVIVVGSSMDKN